MVICASNVRSCLTGWYFFFAGVRFTHAKIRCLVAAGLELHCEAVEGGGGRVDIQRFVYTG